MNDTPESTLAVWKFGVPLGERPGFEPVSMPVRSEILHVGQQHDNVFVWALVDPNEDDHEDRHLGAFPTGGSFQANAPLYHGTTAVYAVRIVVHVFEEMAP